MNDRIGFGSVSLYTLLPSLFEPWIGERHHAIRDSESHFYHIATIAPLPYCHLLPNPCKFACPFTHSPILIGQCDIPMIYMPPLPSPDWFYRMSDAASSPHLSQTFEKRKNICEFTEMYGKICERLRFKFFFYGKLPCRHSRLAMSSSE